MNHSDKSFIFIIGAQKSGTTTVHNLLSSHPDTSLPGIKETHYFSNEFLYKKGIRWYYSHFNIEKKIMCEVDPSYLFFPKSASRIKKSIASPKFIVIFRRPMDRALSQYLMSCYRGYEHLSFLNALKSEKERLKNDKNQFSFINHSYIQRGNYDFQLNAYSSIFDRSNFLFIKFDDLITDKKNKNLLKSICSFIDIDSTLLEFRLPKSNTKKKIKSTMMRDLLYKETFFKKAAQLAVPSEGLRNKLKTIINSLNSSNYRDDESKYEINEHIKSLPKEYLDWNNKQTKLLSEISDLDLNDWIYT